MSKKKQKMRQERNVGLAVAREIKEGKLTEHNTGNLSIFKDYVEALEPLPDHLEKMVNETCPVVVEALKQKQKAFLLAPVMKIQKLVKIHDSWVVSGIATMTVGNFVKDKMSTFSLKSIYDADNAILMANEKSEIFTPQVEKIIIEKETEKRISTGIKPKDIDKAIDKTLHKYKANFDYQAFVRVFEEFKNNL